MHTFAKNFKFENLRFNLLILLPLLVIIVLFFKPEFYKQFKSRNYEYLCRKP